MTSLAHADAVVTLASWVAPDADQRALAQTYLGFLEARPDAAHRTCAPGHLTASAVVFSHDLAYVALVLHRIVGVWVQPGGHVEAGDATMLDAARREVREELGLEVAMHPDPVSLNCHAITCRGYQTPTRHFDIRFAGRAHPDAELVLSDESAEVAWWPVDALPDGVFDEVRDLVLAGRRALVGR